MLRVTIISDMTGDRLGSAKYDNPVIPKEKFSQYSKGLKLLKCSHPLYHLKESFKVLLI